MAEIINGKLQLPNVTLAAATSVKVRETIRALSYSMRGIDFGEVLLITHKKPAFLPKGISYRHIDEMKSIDDFNYNMVYNLGDYIDTDYVLLVHYDGFVVHPEKWQDAFLDYDYIGSPWPLPKVEGTFLDANGNLCRVGNSVSIRSKRLLNYPKKAGIPFETDDGCMHEDGFLCVSIRHLLEAEGMRIAPLELAAQFGREHTIAENKGIDTFVFHKWWGENATCPNFTKKPDPITRAVRRLKKKRKER